MVALTTPFAQKPAPPLSPCRYRRAGSGVRPGLVGRHDRRQAGRIDPDICRKGLSEIYTHPATGPYAGVRRRAISIHGELTALTDPRMPGLLAARGVPNAAALRTFHASNINGLDRSFPGRIFAVQLARAKGYCRNGQGAFTVSRLLMSSPAFAIPPDLTRDTGIWPGPTGRSRFGRDEHKRLFCKTLLDTHDPYKPGGAGLAQAGSRKRKSASPPCPSGTLRCRPKTSAGLNVCTYAEGVPDPLLRKAIELNGFEERRHRHVLANLVEAYGIKLAPEPVYEKPKDPEWAFMVTGYSECIDSFFAFGLFKAAKDTGYFPPELVDTFDPVVNEEARHILFFVELDRLASPQHAVVAPALFRAQGFRGLAVLDL